MSLDDLKEEFDALFNPEPDEDSGPFREFPIPRLEEVHKLDVQYMRTSDWEGSSFHKHSRLSGESEAELQTLTRNQDVPERLFLAALRLMADSVVSYYGCDPREGDIRFYPPAILTFWAGFETFIKYASELLIITATQLPDEVIRYLREEEVFITPRGIIKSRQKFRAALDRYTVFLRYAYGYEVDRSEPYWKDLEKAKTLRDYYTHLDVSLPRSVTSTEVFFYMEAILLALIIPSCRLKRTLMLGEYRLYDMCISIAERSSEFRERPFFLDWYMKEQHVFHCNFEDVDSRRFPSMRVPK